MKESYGEGLATHSDPESCGFDRKAGLEALTGAHVGLPLSRETLIFQGADVVQKTEGDDLGTVNCEVLWNPDRSETQACTGNSSGENREIPGLPLADGAGGRIG